MSKAYTYKGKVRNSSETWVVAERIREINPDADIGSTVQLDGETVQLVAYWSKPQVFIYEVIK